MLALLARVISGMIRERERQYNTQRMEGPLHRIVCLYLLALRASRPPAIDN